MKFHFPEMLAAWCILSVVVLAMFWGIRKLDGGGPS